MGKIFKNPILFMEFSENFVKARPVSGVPVKPRMSGHPPLSRGTIVRMMEEGFCFYRNFEYNRGLSVVEKFVLRENSLAKSLRYSFLETAKISLIGSVGQTGFLFPVEDDSELARISTVLRFSRSKSLDASLTHIESIGGFYPNEKLELSKKFVQKAVFDKTPDRLIRFRCFPFADAAEKVAVFLAHLGASSIKIYPDITDSIFIEAHITDYKPKLTTILNHSYISEISEPETVEITEHYLRHEDLFADCVMEKTAGESYPTVGIIDSGVAENSFLRKWEAGRELFVEPEQMDTAHGTFVTGRALACGESFGGTEFLDVAVMPGRTGTPPDLARLAEILRIVVPKYRDKIKIWNLSLGTNITAGENVSLFAYLLDCIQREQDVLFVLPAGNYTPLRTWSTEELRDDDLITIP
ncbi:MAG: S8 family serine peptidase, partial [Geovibrio sp.]|nr:S8 family serine peptidase [Geovibrio sp.]